MVGSVVRACFESLIGLIASLEIHDRGAMQRTGIPERDLSWKLGAELQPKISVGDSVPDLRCKAFSVLHASRVGEYSQRGGVLFVLQAAACGDSGDIALM